MDTSHNIDRREALRRAAILLGGAISAPTIAAVLKGADSAWAASAVDALQPWAPRTLSAAQLELVATIADRIIPPTGTPGARAAGVPQFIDTLLTDYYLAPERDRYLAGLQAMDYRARRANGKPFMQLTRKQQDALLTQLDRDAFAPKQMVASADNANDKTLQPPPRDPLVGPGSNSTGATPQKPVNDEGMTDAIRAEMGSDWFWHRMKELTVVGYYTSQPGATQELRGPNPMGFWRGDMPYHHGDRAWA
jgi:gluconate 2-dehydrogenase gamma chain